MNFESGTSALRKYLVSLPRKLHYEPRLLKLNLYRCLYFAITKDGEYLRELFPNSDAPLPEDWDDVFSLFEKESNFYQDFKSDDNYTHPSHKPCARPFKSGEPIYRCIDCGFDDTCVLCVYCFNKTDHKDHKVVVSISSGSNGGICDCGDPEAFVNKVNCKCVSKDEDTTSLDPEFQEYLKPIIDVCLDYVLDIMNYSIQTIPFIHSNINSSIRFTSTILSEYSSLPAEKYGATDTNSDEYYLLLWNDEFHNFEQATTNIKSAINCSDEKAKDIATAVDIKGRVILQKAKSASQLYASQIRVEEGGLVSTICTSRDYMREEMASIIIDWLVEVTSGGSNSNFKDGVRMALSQSLLESFEFSKPFTNELLESIILGHRSLKSICAESGLLYDSEIPGETLGKIKKGANLMSRITEICAVEEQTIVHSRVQYLLYFDIRFSKSLRRTMHSFITPILVSDLNFKAIFRDQLVDIYPQLLIIMGLTDRESHLNALTEVTTQLFTCPTTINSIINSGKLGNIISPLIQLMETTTKKTSDNREVFTQRLTDGRSMSLTLTRGMHDIIYLVEKCSEKSKLLEQDNLTFMLLLLKLFQGYWPFERKYGDHVEHETLDYYIHSEYTAPIFNIVQSVAEGASAEYGNDPNNSLVKNALRLIIDFLALRKLPKQEIDGEIIMDFQVSRDEVSLVHPINSLLSAVIQNNKFTDYDYLRSKAKSFLQISDISLRTIVLCSQIRIGFWVRNGYSISRHASIYYSSAISENGYLKDVHLNQISALIEPPRETVLNMLDRWGLLHWYLNEENFSDTVFQERSFYVAEEFIIFVYGILTNRINFLEISDEEKMLRKIRSSISYTLCREPESYSELTIGVSDEVTNHPMFESILREITNYSPPTGLADVGMFRLKPEIYKELDPLSLFNDSSDYEEISAALIKNIAKSEKQKEENIILVPEVISLEGTVYKTIGSFTTTLDFAKVIYKLLQTAIDEEEEGYLPHLLHLIHAILIDDELVNGKDHLPPAFNSIPISFLLLTIVESSMTKFITKKAEFLLDSFIKKEASIMESLVDSMGEEHMKAFTEMRLGSLHSDADKKKQIAKSRQARLMKKLAKQQNDFMNNNKALEDDTANDAKNENDQENDHDLRVCISCGDRESNDEIFGLLAYIGKSSVFWQLPFDDITHTRLAFNNWEEQSLDSPGSIGYGFQPGADSTGREMFGSEKSNRYVASSCGHGLHFRCFKQYTAGLFRLSREDFPCPLCSSVHNSFIPTFITPKTATDFDSEKDPVLMRYNEIVLETQGLNCFELENKLFTPEFLAGFDGRTKGALLTLSLQNVSKFNSKVLAVYGETKSQYFATLQGLSALIGNTISMNEISTRLTGRESYSDFLEDIPDSNKELIKSLIQFRAILTIKKTELIDSKYKENVQYERFWDKIDPRNGVFTEFTTLFFQTNESLRTLSKFTLTKYITIICYSLLLRCDYSDEQFATVYNSSDKSLSSEKIESFRYFLREKVADEFEPNTENGTIFEALLDDEFITNFYFAVERCVLPLLRDFIIFSNSLTVHSIDIRPRFLSLKMDLEGENYVDSCELLCEKLNIPHIFDLIETLNHNPSSFEYKIFDNVISAKIPRYFDRGILSIEYPGMIRLINLPDNLEDFMDNEDFTTTTYDYRLCLNCGKKLYEYRGPQIKEHIEVCNMNYGMFFNPNTNVIAGTINLYGQVYNVTKPAPYLTVHGEVKTRHNTGKATLNHMRYKHLNKMWINQGIIALFSRELNAARRRQEFNFGEAP